MALPAPADQAPAQAPAQDEKLDLSAGLDDSPKWASVAKPGPYTTKLTPDEEAKFKTWVQQNKVPWQDSPTADYDMRGFWKGLTSGDPRAQTGINSQDHKLHYTDVWKTPYHETFSNESQYALPNAGHWQGNTFVPPASSKLDLSAGLEDATAPAGAPATPKPERAIVQTHPGGPVIDLANPPTSGPMDIRDIVAVGKYHKATTSPEQLAQESRQANADATQKATGLLPAAGAAALTLAAPPVGALAGAGLAGLGAGAGEATRQLANRATGAEKVPGTSLAAAGDIAKEGGLFAGMELGAKAATATAGWMLRRYFPEIHEAIGQMTDALVRAVPDTAPNETAAIGYRHNLEAAAPDLQRIAKRSLAGKAGVFDPNAPGGMLKTEFRPTNLWKDTNSYMSEMYQSEIAPMVKAADEGKAKVFMSHPTSPDDIDAVQRAMKKLSTIPDYDEFTHHIAARVAKDPTAPISMHDAEVLNRAVNQQLRKYQRASGTAAETMASTERMTPVFVHVDKLLGDAIEREMTGLGQPSLRPYERRYAALADFRENLGKLLGPTERQRLGLAPTSYVNPRGVGTRFYLRMGQNPGRQIEYAMRQLARADDIPMGLTGAQPLPGIPTPVQPGGAGGPGAGPGGAGPGPIPGTGLPPATPGQLPGREVPLLQEDTVSGGMMDRATRAMQLRDQLAKLGDRFPEEQARIKDELAEIDRLNRASERRMTSGEPPAGQAERRASTPSPTLRNPAARPAPEHIQKLADSLGLRAEADNMGLVHFTTQDGNTFSMAAGKVTPESVQAKLAGLKAPATGAGSRAEMLGNMPAPPPAP